MILVDNQQKTMEQLKDMFHIPLETIHKSSEFAINDNLKGYDLGSRKKRDANAQKFPSFFFTEDNRGISREIRYASSKSNVKNKKGEITEVFSPRKVQIDGDLTIPAKLDLAVFLYLHPKNRQSPFRNEATIWTYEFVDKQQLANSRIGRGDAMLSALNHAKTAKGKDLKLIAKGMGIVNVDMMTELEIQASLSDMAMANPSAYLQKVDKQITKFEGRVLDCIDKRVFTQEDTFGSIKWVWNAGDKKGQLICEVTNKTVTPEMFLIQHIKGHINEYNSDINNIQKGLDVDQKAEEFLRDAIVVTVDDEGNPIEEEEIYKDEVDSVVIEEEEEDVTLQSDDDLERELNGYSEGEEEFVFDVTEQKAEEPYFPKPEHKECHAYLTFFKGSNASPKQASDLRKEIEAGNLQPSNIREWISENMGF